MESMPPLSPWHEAVTRHPQCAPVLPTPFPSTRLLCLQRHVSQTHGGVRCAQSYPGPEQRGRWSASHQVLPCQAKPHPPPRSRRAVRTLPQPLPSTPRRSSPRTAKQIDLPFSGTLIALTEHLIHLLSVSFLSRLCFTGTTRCCTFRLTDIFSAASSLL